MGSSFCCYNFDRKEQVVMQSDLLYETFKENENNIDKEKEINNGEYIENDGSNRDQEKNKNNSIQKIIKMINLMMII